LKKIASVLLISLLLLNWFGYNLVVNYLQHNADIRLEALLDNSVYEEEELIEIKIPTNIPYLNSWAHFERYDGEVEMNGKIYKYVKRKVYNDTLYLLCIPNTKKMQLENSRNDYLATSGDYASNNTGKSGKSKPVSLKNLLSEYDATSFVCHVRQAWKNEVVYIFSFKHNRLLTFPHISPGQPPDNKSC
jgi:hypothetical protein